MSFGSEWEFVQSLGGGRNNNVSLCRDKNGNLVVRKLYSSQRGRSAQSRMNAELAFISHLEACGFNKKPMVISVDEGKNEVIFDYIDGNPVTGLDETDIIQIVDMIVKSNIASSTIQKLGDAAERSTANVNWIEGIRGRLKKAVELTAAGPGTHNVQKWLLGTLEPIVEIEGKKLVEKMVSEDAWKNAAYVNYASPSDIGIHNMIRKKDALWFIDFEYAGRDDIAKLMADLILQPNYLLERKLSRLLVKEARKGLAMSMCDQWRDRMVDLLPLISLKWSMIMLRPNSSNDGIEERLDSAKDYLERTYFAGVSLEFEDIA